MISVFQAIGWLNAIDNRHHLNSEHKRLIAAALKLSLYDARAVAILARLRNMAFSSKDCLEKGEILLWCAAIEYWVRCFPDAGRDAQEAFISYDSDDHRRAVALWVLGMAQWEMRQNPKAFRNWADAKEIFQRRQIIFQHFQEERDWYKYRIWHMDVDSASHPEEVASWLNCFERSSLRPVTQQIVKSVHNNIRLQAYPNVYVLIEDLQEATRRCEEDYEKAEIYLEFGLAVYQMGNRHFSVELLRNAVQNFYPGVGMYHKQVVARCMLGAVEWTQKISRNQAAAHWEQSIADFESLRRWADRDNLQDKQTWYKQRCAILQAAMLEQCNQTSKPPKQDDAPKPRGSPPPG
jgi:hypothetical protein